MDLWLDWMRLVKLMGMMLDKKSLASNLEKQWGLVLEHMLCRSKWFDMHLGQMIESIDLVHSIFLYHNHLEQLRYLVGMKVILWVIVLVSMKERW